MKRYKAVVASSGLIVGKAHVFDASPKDIPKFRISFEMIDKEKERFAFALHKAKDEIKLLQKNSPTQNTYNIIESYLLMIEDKEFHDKVHFHIQEKLCNTEWAIYDVIQNFIHLLGDTDKYLQEREHDLNEVITILVSHLLGKDTAHLNIQEPSIIIARMLLTSDFLYIPRKDIAGIVTEQGGINSHVCIIAKSYGIPMLVGVPALTNKVNNGDQIIVDAKEGFLYTNIDDALKQKYEIYTQQDKKEQQEILNIASTSKHKTEDNQDISFFFNLELIEEMQDDTIALSDGVGLLRTEFLFPVTGSYFNEEQQFQTYMQVVSKLKDKPITIRIFDMGGDKTQTFIYNQYEENPLMGFRGIRFSFAHKELILSQLRSILKTSHYGTIRILVPMISTLEEWDNFLSFLELAKRDLDHQGIAYDKNIQIGPMIEVPSILYILDELAETSDFWSIGTNDLLQFIMAADRTNAKVQYLNHSLQPSFLRILRDIFHKSYELNMNISICGEMASGIKTAPLLLGTGLRNFSVSCSRLAHIIADITKLRVDETRALFEDAIHSKTVAEVEKKVDDFLFNHNKNKYN